MRRFSLLVVLLLASIANYAVVVQGTVTDQNSQPVPNIVVYVSDSANSAPFFTVQATTNASGFYSATVPSTVPNGTTLLVYTYSCGLVVSNSHLYNGSNITSNLTICTTTTPAPDTMSGLVTLPGSSPATSSPAYPAIVYLVEQTINVLLNDTLLYARDSTYTNAQGYYEFTYFNNSVATFLVKAALLPNTPNYANYLPTYHTSSLSWNTATAATFVPGATNIQMIAGVNSGGPGFIGGSVLQGANKTSGVGDPLSQKLLLLTTMSNTPVAYVYSDINGQFSFSNIAYGTYKVFGDVVGKLNPALIVTIDPTNSSVNNIIFEENSNDFTGHFGPTSVGNITSLGAIQYYPNPANDQLTIAGLENYTGTKHITLQNMNGAIVYSTKTDKAKTNIPMSQLAKGIYVLTVETIQGTGTYKIVK